MWSNTPVYVAGLLRGVRPMGDWSMSMTLSRCLAPSMPSCSPARSLVPRLRRAAMPLCRISLTSVDLPEPETPVTQVKAPTGNETSMSLRLCMRAPRTVNHCSGMRRWPGSSMRRRPAR